MGDAAVMEDVLVMPPKLRGLVAYFAPSDTVGGAMLSDPAELRARLRAAALIFDVVIIPLSYIYDDSSKFLSTVLSAEEFLIRSRKILFSMRSEFQSLSAAADRLCQEAIAASPRDSKHVRTQFALLTPLIAAWNPAFLLFDTLKTEKDFRGILTSTFKSLTLDSAETRSLADEILGKLESQRFLTRTAVIGALQPFNSSGQRVLRTGATMAYWISGSNSNRAVILCEEEQVSQYLQTYRTGVRPKVLTPFLEQHAFNYMLTLFTFELSTLLELAQDDFQELVDSSAAKRVRAKLFALSEAARSNVEGRALPVMDVSEELTALKEAVELAVKEARRSSIRQEAERQSLEQTVGVTGRILSLGSIIAGLLNVAAGASASLVSELVQFLQQLTNRGDAFSAFERKMVVTLGKSRQRLQ